MVWYCGVVYKFVGVLVHSMSELWDFVKIPSADKSITVTITAPFCHGVQTLLASQPKASSPFLPSDEYYGNPSRSLVGD